MKYIGRFAPSPTGPLHFGSLVAALASYFDARANEGSWLVRIEDVDETRCKPVHAANILRTLERFGFTWDGEVLYQSQRKPRYEAALQTLADRGLIYACTCSRKEIADSALNGIEGPVYSGTCRAAGHAFAGHALRVRTHDRLLLFTDRLQGDMTQHIESQVGDFVVKRRDGLFAYQLAVVVDDAEQKITHVVRGADLLDSTARQIHLQQLLGYATPAYLHIPVAMNASGQKLSKQTWAPDISTGDISQLLIRGLTFLGQPVAGLSALQSPAAILAAAASHWRTTFIPQQRALYCEGT